MIRPIEVEDGLYRGPSPVADEDFKLLRSLGIKYTLDLQTGAAFMSDGSPLQEAERADAFGIRTYSHPLGEILPPTKGELRNAYWFMTRSPDREPYLRPLYVHCKAGVDRTGMVFAYYRMNKFKWTKEMAIEEMKQMGMHWWYFFWLWFLT